ASNADRARARVHFAICEMETSPMRMNGPVGEHQLQVQTAALGSHGLGRRVAPMEIEILLFADDEVALDRIERRNGGDQTRSRTDQGAYLLLRNTRDAVDGGDQVRESQVQLRCFGRRLRGLNGCRGRLDLRFR